MSRRHAYKMRGGSSAFSYFGDELSNLTYLNYQSFLFFLLKINHTIVQRMNIEPILEANEIDVDKLSICTKVHLQSNSKFCWSQQSFFINERHANLSK